jgi:hypothetical protein
VDLAVGINGQKIAVGFQWIVNLDSRLIAIPAKRLLIAVGVPKRHDEIVDAQ